MEKLSKRGIIYFDALVITLKAVDEINYKLIPKHDPKLTHGNRYAVEQKENKKIQYTNTHGNNSLDWCIASIYYHEVTM